MTLSTASPSRVCHYLPEFSTLSSWHLLCSRYLCLTVGSLLLDPQGQIISCFKAESCVFWSGSKARRLLHTQQIRSIGRVNKTRASNIETFHWSLAIKLSFFLGLHDFKCLHGITEKEMRHPGESMGFGLSKSWGLTAFLLLWWWDP